jgi:hypothetical protein
MSVNLSTFLKCERSIFRLQLTIKIQIFVFFLVSSMGGCSVETVDTSTGSTEPDLLPEPKPRIEDDQDQDEDTSSGPKICENGEWSDGQTGCGPNGRGKYQRLCVNGMWEDTEICNREDVCVDFETRNGTEICGLNKRGILLQECVLGIWEDMTNELKNCNDADVCTDRDVRESSEVCGPNDDGVLEQHCMNGSWVETTICTGDDICTNGETRPGITTCGMNNSGFFEQRCELGEWEDTGNCVPTGECTSGETRSVPNACGIDNIDTLQQLCVLGVWEDSDCLCVPEENPCARSVIECGSMTDRCLSVVNCGSCDSCGMECIDNKCEYRPAYNCQSLGLDCGDFTDECDAQFNCGECGDDQFCDDAHRCVDKANSCYYVNPIAYKASNGKIKLWMCHEYLESWGDNQIAMREHCLNFQVHFLYPFPDPGTAFSERPCFAHLPWNNVNGQCLVSSNDGDIESYGEQLVKNDLEDCDVNVNYSAAWACEFLGGDFTCTVP